MPKVTDLRNRSSHLVWYSGALIWAAAAIGVWVWTTTYEFTTYAADTSQSGTHLPVDSGIVLAGDRPTLLFFIHPRCPCTRASVRELERILGGARLAESDQPNLIVVASLPHNAASQWRDTDTVRSALALPRANLVCDLGGVEASRCGIVTSGAVRLYDPDGTLLYAGGVTASRGHEGDSAGGDRLLALLREPSRAPASAFPVFGCRLCVSDPATAVNDACHAHLPEAIASVQGAP